MTERLIYFADPMCSWCWGFAPVIRALQERYGNRLPIRLMLGGLAVGTSKALDAKGRQTIRAHWDHVADLTGQPFDYGFFEREAFVYDSEPACRAVVAARRLSAPSAIGFLGHLHRGFYSQNQDVTDGATLSALADGFGIDRDRFEAEFESEDARLETLADFRSTMDSGVDGYPALIAGNRRNGYSYITFGYQPWRKIQGVIDSWLETRGR